MKTVLARGEWTPDEAWMRAKFWPRVEKTATCWLWRASTAGSGYGQIRTPDGRFPGAHRVSWIAAHGRIPEGLQVLHRCDVRQCVNPAHLFLGTYYDNMEDMLAKGRGGKTAWANKIKTHCVHGHEFTAENTLLQPNGGRRCRACKKRRDARRRRNGGRRWSGTGSERTAADRFWAKVDRNGECWLWLGSLNDGRGRAWKDGKLVSAHRLAYEMTRGPVPEGCNVYHACSRTDCVRPEHLVLKAMGAEKQAAA